MDRAVMGRDLGQHADDVVGIAGIDDRHVRQTVADRQILGCLVAGAIAGRQARQGAADLDGPVFFRIAMPMKS